MLAPVQIPMSSVNFQMPIARASSHTYKKQTSQLMDPQIGLLAGLYVNPTWIKQQSSEENLVYGVVKPSDTVPKGVSGYSYLVTKNDQDPTYLFFLAKGKAVTIKYGNEEKLHTRRVKLGKLVRLYYRTKTQRRIVDKYSLALKTE